MMNYCGRNVISIGLPDCCCTVILARLQTWNWRVLIFSRVCLSVCLWPALLPFNVDRFWWNLVIMVQISRRGTARCLFENFKKFFNNSQKSQNSNFKILVHHFLCLCLLCIVKKFDSIRTKLTEEIHFEVCPYGDSGNCTAAAARRLLGYSDWTGGVWRSKLGGIPNWGHSELGTQSGRKNQPACSF